MQHDELVFLRSRSPAWRLLRADNAPLILSFLGRVFVEENVRDISASQLISRLDDELFALNERLGDGTYPKSAKAYLEDWAAPEAGWLRKFYPAGSDEPHFDATPAVERAVSWATALRERSFVGTESRLNTVFELLRQLVFGSETDAAARLAELHRRRGDIDREIAAVEAGQFTVLDAVGRRDRYQQFAETGRGLLSDFREVEANFRRLDRDLRECVTTWDGSKGELLDEVVGGRSHIADSDQGRSFQAFYDLLLSPARQAELTELLLRVHQVDDPGHTDSRLRYIHHDWLDAGERGQATVRQLSEQLRRFLDDKVWLENRRVMDLLRSIESRALSLRDSARADFGHEIDATSPTIRLPMERPLYTRARAAHIDSREIQQGRFEDSPTALYEQAYVDPAPLVRTVRKALQSVAQIALPDVVTGAPITQGLSELVTYLSLDDECFATVFDESTRDSVAWTDDDGAIKTARLPRVIYARRGTMA